MRHIDEFKSEGGDFTELDRISQNSLSAILINDKLKYIRPINCIGLAQRSINFK